MVHHSWVSECLKMFGIEKNVKDFSNNSTKSWKLELNSSEVDIKRWIFQEDNLSFVACVVHGSSGCRFEKSEGLL